MANKAAECKNSQRHEGRRVNHLTFAQVSQVGNFLLICQRNLIFENSYPEDPDGTSFYVDSTMNFYDSSLLS